MEKGEEIQELNSHIESYVEENAERENYYSINITRLGDREVRLEIYGVEGGEYPLPEKELVGEAIGNYYGWKPSIQDVRSERNMYSIHVFDSGSEGRDA